MSHDCCHDKKQAKQKKGLDPLLLGISLVTLILLIGAVYFGTKLGASSSVAADTNVSLELNQTSHDWGTIDYDAGMVTKTFTIKNAGTNPLKLYNVVTSCMCTTAQLKTDDQLSKKFGMHEKNSSVFEVKPGSKAELIVEFDPAYHGPSGIGPISRTVTLETNDSSQPTLTFQLKANVIKQ